MSVNEDFVWQCNRCAYPCILIADGCPPHPDPPFRCPWYSKTVEWKLLQLEAKLRRKAKKERRKDECSKS